MIDDKVKKRIWELYEKGNTKKDIAMICEISVPTVRKILKESENYEPELNYSKDDTLVLSLNNQFLDEGYDLESEVKRLTYEFVALSGDFKMTSFDFLKDIITITKRYVKLEGDTLKKYDFFCDISNNMDLITDNYDVSKLCELIDNFIDREIFLEDLESKIEEVENTYKENKDRTKESKMELTKLKEQVAEARNYKNQLARAFIFNAEGEKLKKLIKEKDIAMNNLRKDFSEKKGEAITEYEETINNQKEMIEELRNTINILKQIHTDFINNSSEEIKEFWNEYTNKLSEEIKVNEQ